MKINSDGSLEGIDVIEDARVGLSIPIESEGGDEDLRTLFDCVEEFHHQAQQRSLFVYTVETNGRTFEVDWADRVVREITPSP